MSRWSRRGFLAGLFALFAGPVGAQKIQLRFVPDPTDISFLLLENGDFLLLEDDSGNMLI